MLPKSFLLLVYMHVSIKKVLSPKNGPEGRWCLYCKLDPSTLLLLLSNEIIYFLV